MSTNLTTEELAKRLHLSVGTIHNWASLGIGPAYMKVGRRRLYRLEDIQEWEASQVIEQHAPQATACG